MKGATWLRSGLALGLLLVATGCQVSTHVAVTAGAKGSGTIAVTVTLDAQAAAAVGNLAQQLQTSDLTRAGWVVAGPVPGEGGSETVSARHGFSSPAELHALAAQLAGSGPEASRPFQLELRRTKSWWHTGTELSGDINLKCGLSCFADAGLQSAGVNPGSLGLPAQAVSFSLSAALDGHVVSTNAESRAGAVETWRPALGQTTTVMVVSRVLDTGHVILVGLLAAAGLAGILVVVVGWRRRRGGSAPASPPPLHRPPVSSST